MNKYKIFISSVVCVMVFLSPSLAQGIKKDAETTQSKPVINIEAEAIKGINLGDVTYDKSKFKLSKPVIDLQYKIFKSSPFDEIRDLYKGTGYVDLTHLYWKTGALDIADDDAVDAFLLLTQCKNVGGSYGNDFEWNALREKTREYIRSNKNKFSKKLKFYQPLNLGTYNFEKKAFDIIKKYQYNRSKRFLISNNLRGRGDFCVNSKRLSYLYTKYAPYNVVLSTNSSFTLTRLPMSSSLSKLYLDYLDRNNLDKTPRIVFYMSLELFQGIGYGPETATKYVAEYSGSIDYVEVYADEAETRLLYKMDLR